MVFCDGWWRTGLGGFGSGPARGSVCAVRFCLCVHACALGDVRALKEKKIRQLKSRAVRRLSPRRSCGPAAAHAEAEAVEGELLEEAADEAAVERGGWRSHVFLFKALPLSGGTCRDPFRNAEFCRLFRRVRYVRT